MEGFLRVNSEATTLPGSPTNSFLTDEIGSTCPLLTPSPPTNDLINPMPEHSDVPPSFMIGGDVLACKLQRVQGNIFGGYLFKQLTELYISISRRTIDNNKQ